MKVFTIIAIIITEAMLLTGQSQSALSYNVRYDNPKDSLDSWDHRKDKMAQLIKHYQPGFLGVQEALRHQLEYLDSSLKDFHYIGVGRDDGKEGGEFSAIFYDTTQFTLIDHATFWLSDTPHQVSVGWDAALERICTYGLFENRSFGKKIWVFNTHFDHKGTIARFRSAKLILQRIQEVNLKELPVILMGDFNAQPCTDPINILTAVLEDGKEISKTTFYGPKGTFNGFDTDAIMDKRIDYIFTKSILVQSYGHIDERRDDNRHISDHLAVFIEFNF